MAAHRKRSQEKIRVIFCMRRRAAQLNRLVFPLGESTKEEVRAEAVARNLPGATKGESQELCFVGAGAHAYASFVEKRSEGRARPGPIVDDTGRVVGQVTTGSTNSRSANAKASALRSANPRSSRASTPTARRSSPSVARTILLERRSLRRRRRSRVGRHASARGARAHSLSARRRCSQNHGHPLRRAHRVRRTPCAPSPADRSPYFTTATAFWAAGASSQEPDRPAPQPKAAAASTRSSCRETDSDYTAHS